MGTLYFGVFLAIFSEPPTWENESTSDSGIFGSFTSRSWSRIIPNLTASAACPGFQQAAGFLRIFGGSEPLDALPIHPESGLAAWLGDGPIVSATIKVNQEKSEKMMIGWFAYLFINLFIYLFNIILYILYYLINYIYIKMNLSLSMLSSLSMSILSLSILEAARVRESSVDSCVTFLLGRLAAFKVNREA